jgi:hypothetical protein
VQLNPVDPENLFGNCRGFWQWLERDQSRVREPPQREEPELPT